MGYIAAEGNRDALNSSRMKRRTSIRKQSPARSNQLLVLFSIVAALVLIGMLVDTVYASASQASEERDESAALVHNGDEAYSAQTQYNAARIVEVQAGDSLWSIAREHKPNHMNIRTYLNQLKMINGLTDSLIYEGMLLRLPE
jgi:uncharacterized protein YlxW (UPF0749 family)